MDACDLIRRLHEHRMWVNRKLLDAARQLIDDQLRQPLAIGQGSIWRSMTHLYAAEFVWLEALLGNDDPLVPGDVRGKLPGNQAGEGGPRSLEDLTAKWHELERRWDDYLSNITADSLDRIVYKVSTSSGYGKRHGTRQADVLLHVCTHSQYTTAQVVNMLRQLGASPLPDVMLISLAREQVAR